MRVRQKMKTKNNPKIDFDFLLANLINGASSESFKMRISKSEYSKVSLSK